MSKLDIKNDEYNRIQGDIDNLVEKLEKNTDVLRKEQSKLNEQFRKEEKKTLKKIRKLFGRVKTDITLNQNECIVKINNEKVFTLNYNEFSFLNIERDLGLDIKTLFEELYGEPQEKSFGNYIFLNGVRGSGRTYWTQSIIDEVTKL